jgi:hypothetical protein
MAERSQGLEPLFRRARATVTPGAAREVVRPNRLFRRLVVAVGLPDDLVGPLFDECLARQDATPATVEGEQLLVLEAEIRSLTMNHLAPAGRVAASSRLDELFMSLRLSSD